MTAKTIEEAFAYAFAIYDFARVTRDISNQIAQAGKPAFNTMVHGKKLSDAQSRTVTKPNNDTINSTAILELSASPVELIVPDEPDNYFSFAFMDTSTDHFAYIGTRETGGRGGRFVIAGPDWQEPLPQDAAIIRSPTNDVWVIARYLVNGEADLPRVLALQKQIEMRPLIADATPRAFAVNTTTSQDPENFIGVVNEVIGRSSPHGNARRIGEFAQFGLVPGEVNAWNTLSSESQQEWQDVCTNGLRRLLSRSAGSDAIQVGWMYPNEQLGNFGDNDRLRAVVALNGLAALECKEAWYSTGVFDSRGKLLTGEHAYTLDFDTTDVPARAFWSLTMYESSPDGRFFFTENQIDRYSIGDRTRGVFIDENGMMRVHIQRQKPADPNANWLPAPEGGFQLTLRLYNPEKKVLDGQWQVPPVIHMPHTG